MKKCPTVLVATLMILMTIASCDRQAAQTTDIKAEVQPGRTPNPACGVGREAGEVRYYSADNLHDYNNGAAELYLRNGFIGLATVDCRGPGKAVTVSEIFDMGTPEGARKMFDYDRGEIGADLKIADGGFFAGGSAEALKGQYLLRTMTLASGDDPAGNAIAIVKAGLTNIP